MSIGGRKILVADDDPDQMTFVSTVFEDAGATVLKAHNGNDVLETARREKPDLLTLDISMPGKDVAEVYRALREDASLAGLKVLIASGRPRLRTILYDISPVPPDGFLDKPFSDRDLLSAAEKLLGGVTDQS